MKAIVQDRYGPPETLTLDVVAKPRPRAGEVLVQVEAAGLGPDVWHLTTGLPYPVRLAARFSGLRQPFAGLDLAGRVAELGPGTTGFAVGDRVFGTGFGAFAEYTRARADRVAHLPDGVGFEEAAATPVSGTTALQALRDKAGVRAGSRVAVLGAGGGVGSFAVQIAKVLGAEVTGVCGPDKAELVAGLGADRVVDYTREDFTAAGPVYDAVIDTAGHRTLRELRRALAPGGALVIVGSETGGRWLGGVDRPLRAMLLSPFTKHRLGSFISDEDRDTLETLAGYLADGSVRPVVGAVHPLEEVPLALRRWHEGHARGRTVIRVA